LRILLNPSIKDEFEKNPTHGWGFHLQVSVERGFPYKSGKIISTKVLTTSPTDYYMTVVYLITVAVIARIS
jgi:hypothetical protein